MKLHYAAVAALVTVVASRRCKNLRVPVCVEARNGKFDLKPLETEIESTNLFLRLSRPGQNYSDEILQGYETIKRDYELAATYCEPDEGPGRILQILTHGVAFDRGYWDLPYHNYNYSYAERAANKHGFSTLAWDRIGAGDSSKGDPINEIQIFLEIAALRELTKLAAEGGLHVVDHKYDQVVHVGHSFGSVITHAYSDMYPDTTKAIVLTGFTQVGVYAPYFELGANWVPVQEYPSLAAKFPPGSITPRTSIGLHISIFGPDDFDPELMQSYYDAGVAASPGEVLTLGSLLRASSKFSGDVLIITGENDVPFCGGNCRDVSPVGGGVPDLLAASKDKFPRASSFKSVVVPGAGHALNFEYSHPFTYSAMFNFFEVAKI